MKNIDLLLETAQYLNLKDEITKLERIKNRSSQPNAKLLLPLVGEFSSGKTTLINSLTDSKALETATKPTTATIYEVHFGNDKCHASVLNKNGHLEEVKELTELKNEILADAVVVNLFDTSTRIPSTTILVDTPGLSSPDPQHKQTLIDFLPMADGVLLVTDVNQQITRSLTDFIATMQLAKCPIFLVITKCDTKSANDLEQAKKYIADNCKLPIQQIACVSAAKDDLQEFYDLLNQIQKEKNTIIKQVDEQRIKNISNHLIQHINELLKASSSDKELEESIRKQEHDLNSLSRKIENLIESMSENIQEKEKNSTRKFEDTVSDKLEQLVVTKSQNFDADAISTINNTSSILLNDYKSEIEAILREHARKRQNTEEEISLQALEEIDLSIISINGLNYNLDLNSAGHQYDGMISTGVKVAAAVAAVAAVGAVAAAATTAGGAAAAATAGEAAAATTALEGGAALKVVGTVTDVADTVSDIASMDSNNKTARRIENAMSFARNTGDQFSAIDGYNQQAGQQVGSNKGIVESMVGFFTDKAMGKPQRKRAISIYINDTLLPEFNMEMKRVRKQLTHLISNTLHAASAETITLKKEALEQLKTEQKEQKTAYEQKIKQLRDYKNKLMIL